MNLFREVMWLKLHLFWLVAQASLDRLYYFVFYGFDIKEVIEKNGEKYFGW